MTPASKSLLLITYFFPPYNLTEHRHAATIARAAVQSGWNVDVIAPWAIHCHSDGQDPRWESSFKGPGQLRVHRTPDRLSDVAPQFCERVARLLGNRLSSLFRFPDSFVTWLLFVMPRAARLLRKNRSDVLITSSFPYSAHIAGLALHVLFRRPWIADTRDGWALDEKEQFTAIEPSARRRLWHRRLMGAVVRHACQFWSVTPDIREAARAFFNRQPEEKFIAIMQGFSAVDFSEDAKPSRGECLVLGYAGNFRPGLTPAEPIAAALQRLKERPSDVYCRIRIRVWGYQLPVYHRQFMELLERFGIADRFESLHSIPEEPLIRQLRDCDAVLLTNGASEWTKKRLSSKLFIYFSVRRPILAVCEPDSAIARVVAKTKTGRTLSASDTDGLCALLEEWAQLRAQGAAIPYQPAADALLPYSLEDGVIPQIALKLDQTRGVS